MTPLSVVPVLGLPEVVAGNDVAALLVSALGAEGLRPGDVVVVSSKVISKALGLRAAGSEKSELVLGESVRVVAERRSGDGVTRVVEAVAGPVMAAAGIDASNTGPAADLLLLPHDPDACARDLRSALLSRAGMPSGSPFAVVLSDTAGRPWRAGLTDFALGSAGLRVLLDHRGEADVDGRVMSVTARAVADELAAAADLVKGKADGVAAAVVRGLPEAWFVGGSDEFDSGAAGLVRTGPGDWFAMGHVEAVRAALGVNPGSPESELVGIRAVGAEPFADRVSRVVALTLFQDEEASIDVEVRSIAATPTGGDAAGGDAARDSGSPVSAIGTGATGNVSPGSPEAAVTPGSPEAVVTLGAADDFALGQLTQRLVVAAASEDLRAEVLGTPSGEHTVTARLSPGR
ncbi:coenzyme F420-0:L-glutamate ligase [Knoellia locipacati]|uniref:coenzyme F420-0:L-glutamate ligase n=1 Tax=Knoellia locipacati TaxID=882824 RepID=UPI00384CA415